ncbi:glycine--tRNA ligase subunit beta [Alteriqipengyuania flavescens]|uniref:glycine--tRNA ligase subunit beta n=1 Tax=Alteriqipengyuania flavescens TaxID=3053610 RepID=UPI0025B4E01E|nr:glycine--tRNA ligase subunit beta [Alteriqipengyuania flavescens]WJY18294.1 glycine--tRNA ligase subunit beta [Alteriqipengyuania flavescens]WJY24235.1 glycine--tRNA ligase subunit beta [Alteriqipengyuania flavescens]
MPDFLLELRSEEIPARMQADARAELEKLFRREMDAAALRQAQGERLDVTVWSTPRRLALIARGLPEATEAVSEELKGPPVGAPEQALEGFCRKAGVDKADLEIRDVKGRETYFAVKNIPGRATKDLLASAIPAIVRDFSWPKSMRWGAASISTESLRWVRPLSGIVALLGTEIVECEVHGVTSGAVTLGHRFHHSGDITIGGADDYAMKLRAGHVIVDHEERAAIIREGARNEADSLGLEVIEDEGLVIENAGLTEWPVVLSGGFDEAFLEIPPEVIQLSARVHQKYFIAQRNDDELSPTFICTANIDAKDGGAAVIAGNEKVLGARLSDARFFWDVDRKKTLAEHAEGLRRITFHEKLGTVADKVERLAKLARWLIEEGIVKPSSETTSAHPEPVEGSDAVPATRTSTLRQAQGSARAVGELADMAEQAARLAKADLVTEMVGEFPELQGLMGGYYARAEGLPDAVADAIRDHYKPVGQGDDVPTAPVTVAVSLADKLDTLFALWGAGEKPTGSKDPFALRRQAISILTLIAKNELRINIKELIERAYKIYASGPKADTLGLEVGDEIRSSAPIFFREMEGIEGGRQTELFLYREANFEGSDWKDFELGFYDPTDDPKPIGKPVEDGLVGVYSTFQPFSNLQLQLLEFFADRLKVQQREAGVRHDLIDAVFALGGEDDLVRLLARVKALQSFMDTEDGANLLAGYKRAANILKKGDWQGGADLEPHTGEEDPLALVDDPDMRAVVDAQLHAPARALSYTPEKAEQGLIDALDEVEPKAAAAVEEERFADAMAALASLRAPIDVFFEEVTVNADDAEKRQARLGLLARFRDAVHEVADFSRIEG